MVKKILHSHIMVCEMMVDRRTSQILICLFEQVFLLLCVAVILMLLFVS